MYARVTRVLAWILPIIQSGECGWFKEAELRKAEKRKKEQNQKRKNNG